ncbi:MAG TPA: pitrilysin family protein [Candidatus Acidoferrales bacterium]|jgi:zinc protease|nr:pitrilysin family protein [Candidatus Acidoferrales bacterium]
MGSAPSSGTSSIAPPLAPARPVIWPPRVHKTLSNGLEVVLVESHTIPKFTGELFFRSGNAVVAAKAPGLADMTATVARTGTTRRTSREIEEDLRRMGSDLSSGAGADTSVMSFAGLVDFSIDLLELVSELAQQASFPEDEFERERRQLVEGLRIERTTPGFLASERLRRILFGVHPYGTISPTEEQVAGYRVEQLKEFYEHYYRPGNALLVMVGDFAPEKMLAQIEKAFGSWASSPVEAAPDPPLPALQGRRVCLVHLPGSVQTQIVVGNRAITRKHPDWLRLTLANSIYGGAFNSRLVMNIREEKGYTYSPRSGAHPLRQHGYFSIGAAVRNDVVAATLTEIFYEIDRMRSIPVGEDELDDARNYLTGIFSLGLATQDGLAGQLATTTLEKLPEDYLETYRERVLKLTSADVLDAARKYFDSDQAQIVVVGDRAQIASQAAQFGEPEIYDAQGNRI